MPTGRRNRPTETIGECTVKRHTSLGSVWNVGDLLAGYEQPKGSEPYYSVLLCTKARETGPRGAPTAPAELAEIAGPTWSAVVDVVVGLGFDQPSLTEKEVRNPRPRRLVASRG